MSLHRKHLQACLWLIVGTGLWGLSFPVIKAIIFKQQQLVPDASGGFRATLFLASLVVVVRFGVAGIIVLLSCFRTLPTLTRLEWKQGLGLALFGGIGIIFQMDGLAHTSASVSAFLTQFYCLLIPIWVACTRRALPTLAVILSSMFVLAGAAVLAKFDFREFRLGRGEAETLISAVFFAGQILWLEKPEFGQNRTGNFTFVMFAGTAVLAMPVAVLSAPRASAFVATYNDGPVLLMTLALIIFCTVGSYGLMNAWQRHITATEAGLIYCLEPVAASAFALFLPAWLSQVAGIQYANERITRDLIIGGSLILAANVLIQIEAARRARQKAKPDGPISDAP